MNIPSSYHFYVSVTKSHNLSMQLAAISSVSLSLSYTSFCIKIMIQLLGVLFDLHTRTLVLSLDLAPILYYFYSTIMLYFDMGEKGWVTQIRLATRTNIISIIRLVSSSSSPSTLLERMLKTCWKHYIIISLMNKLIKRIKND